MSHVTSWNLGLYCTKVESAQKALEKSKLRTDTLQLCDVCMLWQSSSHHGMAGSCENSSCPVCDPFYFINCCLARQLVSAKASYQSLQKKFFKLLGIHLQHHPLFLWYQIFKHLIVKSFYRVNSHQQNRRVSGWLRMPRRAPSCFTAPQILVWKIEPQPSATQHLVLSLSNSSTISPLAFGKKEKKAHAFPIKSNSSHLQGQEKNIKRWSSLSHPFPTSLNSWVLKPRCKETFTNPTDQLKKGKEFCNEMPRSRVPNAKALLTPTDAPQSLHAELVGLADRPQGHLWLHSLRKAQEQDANGVQMTLSTNTVSQALQDVCPPQVMGLELLCRHPMSISLKFFKCQKVATENYQASITVLVVHSR